MKSNKSIDKTEDENIKCTELPYNHQETLKIQASPLYTRYKKWLKDNGVLIDPRLRYPSYFGQAKRGVVGVSAIKPIEKKRAVIAVPYNLLITVDKVKEDLELFLILKDNLSYFKSDDDAALKLLLLYISSELIKGEKSFYYPYFSISSQHYLGGWENKTLHMLQQKNVIGSIRDQKQQMQLQFIHFLRIYRRYENVFPQKLTNSQYKEIFQKAYIFIITRAFGWSLPSISLIPLADSLNHSNIRYVNHFLVNIDQERRQVAETQNAKVYKKYSKLVNLAILKDECFNLNQGQLSQLRKQKTSKSYKFIQKHQNLLNQSQKILGKQPSKSLNPKNKSQIRSKQNHILYQQYKAGIHKLKNLHFYDSSCDEDNDTDEDDLFDKQNNHQKFLLNDKQRFINENNKKKQITKLWKLYIDNEEDQQSDESNQQKRQVTTKNKEDNNKLKEEIKQKMLKENDSSQVSSDETEQDEDEVLDWTATADHKTTYFIMSTKEIIRQNQQLYNFYGRRSNKFLLSGYNFVMRDNIYDSYWLNIKLDPKFNVKTAPSKLLQFSQKKDEGLKSRPLKLKRYRINQDLIFICRSYIILWNKKQWNNCRLTIPFEKDVEIKTLELYSQIIKQLLKDFSTSLQDDEELEEQQGLKYEERTSIILRKQYKKILKGQQALVSKCLQWVNRWNSKSEQKFEESEMKWIRRIRPYLVSLEESTSI